MRVASLSRTRRRVGTVALALVLALGTLVLAGGSPAGAANTAAEVRNEDKARPFAGVSRFDTAAKLANAYLAERGGETVIIASGRSLVDALAASSLSSVVDAPILLTERNDLPRVARKVISDNEIFEVFIVGGESVVGAGVIQDLERIDDTIDIIRIAGDTRFETATAIGEEVTPGEYCDTGELGALIVNGNSIADAITAGPFAFAAELPILLVETDSVPETVADYIEANEVGHVAIIGGTAVVSTDTEGALEDLGVGVTRIAGATRQATAIAVAGAMRKCDGIEVSGTHYALVNDGRDRDGAGFADGVAGAPVLGGDVLAGANGVVPILLVGAEALGTENQALLSATPRRVGTTFLELKFVAVGGTTAVTSTVMSEAIAAATTSAAITAIVAGSAGASSFTVTYSEPVHTAADSADCTATDGTARTGTPTAASACNLAHYRVGGNNLVVGDTIQIAADNRTVTVNLGEDKLRVGDTLQVLGGKVKAQSDGDNRMAVAASYTVPAGPPDTTRPRVSVSAVHRAREIAITVEDAGVLTNSLELSDIEWDPAGDLGPFDLSTIETGDVPTDEAATEPDLNVVLSQVTGKTGQAGIYKVEFQGVSDTVPFQPGDRFVVKSGAITDAGKRTSRSAAATVIAVTVPDPDNAAKIRQGGVTSARPVKDANASAVFELLNGKRLFTVSAKTGSAAEGAHGNAWRFSLTSVVDTADEGKTETTDVTVDFNSSRKAILVTWDDEAKVKDVITAINGARGFDDLFTLTLHQEAVPIQSAAGIDGDADMPNVQELNVIADSPTAGGAFTSGEVRLSGGLHEVELEFVFDQFLKSFSTAATGHAGDDLKNANRVLAAGLYSWELAFVAPSNTVRMVMQAESAAALPKSGDKFTMPAGTASLYPDFTDGLTYLGNAERVFTLRRLRS